MSTPVRRLPRRVHILDHTITIRQLDKRAFDAEWGEDVDATWEDAERRINIRRHLPYKQKRYLLLHELVHALNDLTHLEAV